MTERRWFVVTRERGELQYAVHHGIAPKFPKEERFRVVFQIELESKNWREASLDELIAEFRRRYPHLVNPPSVTA